MNVTANAGFTLPYTPTTGTANESRATDLPPAEQVTLKSRQGVRYLPLEQLDVLDPETMMPVPRDGQTMGEVMFRGNVVMKGYFRNPQATQDAFAGGWFHSGDLGVMHPRRIYPAQGSLKGHYHFGWRKHLIHRGRRGAVSSP